MRQWVRTRRAIGLVCLGALGLAGGVRADWPIQAEMELAGETFGEALVPRPGGGAIAAWSEGRLNGTVFVQTLVVRWVDRAFSPIRQILVDQGGPGPFRGVACVAIARLADDGVAVAWLEKKPGQGRVKYRVFGPDGEPRTDARYAQGPFRVQDEPCPTVRSGPRGFVLAWSVFVRTFAPDGSSVSPLINFAPGSRTQPLPALSSTGESGFAVAYFENDQIYGPERLMVRRYDWDGEPVGVPVRVSDYRIGGVHLEESGRGLQLAWARFLSDGTSIQAQRLSRDLQLQRLVRVVRVDSPERAYLWDLAVDRSERAILETNRGFFTVPPLPRCASEPGESGSAVTPPRAGEFLRLVRVPIADPDGPTRLLLRRYGIPSCEP